MVIGFQNLGNGGENIEVPKKGTLRLERKEAPCVKIDWWRESTVFQTRPLPAPLTSGDTEGWQEERVEGPKLPHIFYQTASVSFHMDC